MSIIRSHYTFQIVRSPDKSYNIIVMGFWTYAEMAVGIIISSLPVLPRLLQYLGPRISSAFSSESKTGDKTPVRRKVDKRFLGALSSWDEVRPAVSGNSSTELPERGPTIDPSQASSTPALDRLYRLDSSTPLSTLPGLDDQPPGQILRTIRIETKTEPRVIGNSEFRVDIERQSLKSSARKSSK